MIELKDSKWYYPKGPRNAQSLSCQLLFYFGKCMRRIQAKGTIGKTMDLFLSVELVPKTPGQSTSMMNWPTDLDPCP